jgi:hypothetical protein
VMHGEDYLGCVTAASDLRRLQQRHGEHVRLALLYVGNDPRLVAGVMRRERVAAEIHYLSRREFRKQFGELKLPAFFVAQHGKVSARADSPDGVAPPPSARELVERAVSTAIGRKQANSWSGEPASPNPHPWRTP